MDDWLLGYCISCPDGERPGRIDVVASLIKNDQGNLVVHRRIRDLEAEIGKSGKVFWPQVPAASSELRGCLVRFRAEKTAGYGGKDSSRDWLKVARESGSWDVHRFGYRIIDLGSDAQCENEPRWIQGRPIGEQIFIRDRKNSTLLGPWRVGNKLTNNQHQHELVPHPNASSVFEYSIKNIKDTNIIRRNDCDFLLYLPDKSTGQYVDLITLKQLAKWLVDRIVSLAPQVIYRLDSDFPGWRGKIREEIDCYNDIERNVWQGRWKKLEARLESLVFEAIEIEKLLSHPAFQKELTVLFDHNVKQMIECRAQEIEAQAQGKAKAKIEGLQKGIVDAQTRYNDAIAKRNSVESEIKPLLDSLAERERKIKCLTDHFDSSRERLVNDFSVLQSLLPAINPYASLATGAQVNSRLDRTIEPIQQQTQVLIQQGVVVQKNPSGVAITAASEFVNRRLWPQLNRWFPGIPYSLAQMFHAAVCGSKAIIVPSPAWARSYVDALGAFARITIVNVQPTWLGFDDLWNGGLSECWERAHGGSPLIELVLFRDFNRALPQCYARPLLDLIAGFCDTLPVPCKGHWPKTLRLFACTSPPEESLPLTVEVLQHFSAVQRELPVPNKDQPKEVDGHVTIQTWLSWANAPAKPVNDPVLVKEFGPLSLTAMAEVAAISHVLRNLGIAEREAKSTARELRIDEPKKYLPAQEPKK